MEDVVSQILLLSRPLPRSPSLYVVLAFLELWVKTAVSSVLILHLVPSVSTSCDPPEFARIDRETPFGPAPLTRVSFVRPF